MLYVRDVLDVNSILSLQSTLIINKLITENIISIKIYIIFIPLYIYIY